MKTRSGLKVGCLKPRPLGFMAIGQYVSLILRDGASGCDVCVAAKK